MAVMAITEEDMVMALHPDILKTNPGKEDPKAL
jgi:hypothetical protein